jgi:predicted small integral membrane protein
MFLQWQVGELIINSTVNEWNVLYRTNIYFDSWYLCLVGVFIWHRVPRKEGRLFLLQAVHLQTTRCGGLMVSVLATGLKVRGFKPGREQWIFKGDKIRFTLSFGGEVNRRSHVVDLRHVKEPYKYDRCSSAKFSGHVSHPRFTCVAARWQTNQDWVECK